MGYIHEAAAAHWKKHGNTEGRQYKLDNFNSDNFDWKYYLECYPELNSLNLKTYDEALKYYIETGKNCKTYKNKNVTLDIQASPNYIKNLYLNLIKSCLLNNIYDNTYISKYIEDHNVLWPSIAHTMVSDYRLDNLQYCVEQVIKNNIPGDLIETGVWRGGCTILMRAILKAYNITDRKVWVADSFEGLPPPNPKDYPLDKDLDLTIYKILAVSQEQVVENFRKYDLLDDQVIFLKGWFKDTLPYADIKQLAVLRLDGDLYESTIQVLTYLYSKLSVGGYVIIDDYGSIDACMEAVHDYRKENNITEEIIKIDNTGAYWQKLN